jgi:hypothetical protein
MPPTEIAKSSVTTASAVPSAAVSVSPGRPDRRLAGLTQEAVPVHLDSIRDATARLTRQHRSVAGREGAETSLGTRSSCPAFRCRSEAGLGGPGTPP